MNPGGRGSWRVRGWCAGAISAAALAQTVSAGVIIQGRIDHPNLTGIGGLAFDGHRNPIVLNQGDTELWRIDRHTGAVLQTYTMAAPAGRKALAWDESRNCFYTTQKLDDTEGLFIESLPQPYQYPFIGPVQRIARHPHEPFHAQDIEVNEKGQVFFIENDNGGELRQLNQLTVQGVIVTHFNGEIGKLAAMAICPDQDFLVATQRTPTKDSIVYKVDHETGEYKEVGPLGMGIHQRLVDFDYDPMSQRWWGVVKNVHTSSPTYDYVKLTGLGTDCGCGVPTSIPEPGAMGLTAAGIGMLALRRKRKRA